MDDMLLLLDRMNTLVIELLNVNVEFASLVSQLDDNKQIQTIYGKYALKTQKEIDKYSRIVTEFNEEASHAST